jgi:hypothetical protein
MRLFSRLVVALGLPVWGKTGGGASRAGSARSGAEWGGFGAPDLLPISASVVGELQRATNPTPRR